MQLFYLNNTKDEIILNKEESKHLVKVLRKKKGDVLNFTDGKGSLYKAEIIIADNIASQLHIISQNKKEKKHNYYLHIAISPTKNMDRFEWFLEKAAEIGIDEISPVICERSESKTIKEERCNRILISAIKQSIKFHLPQLHEPISIDKFLKKKLDGSKYIAHCQESNKLELKKETTNKALILIGPEGDFTNKEIDMALESNFKSVSLGTSRLRTETAGIVAVNTMSITN